MSVTEQTWTAETVAAIRAVDASNSHAWFNAMYYSRAELFAVVAEYGLTGALAHVSASSIHPDLVRVREKWAALAVHHSITACWSETMLRELRTLLT